MKLRFDGVGAFKFDLRSLISRVYGNAMIFTPWLMGLPL